jgi:putative addiction module antidote
VLQILGGEEREESGGEQHGTACWRTTAVSASTGTQALTFDGRCYNFGYAKETAMIEITVRKVGNSLGLILPSEATKKLGVSEGDILFFTDSQDGFRLTPYDPRFKSQMKSAEAVMKRYRNTLRELPDK